MSTLVKFWRTVARVLLSLFILGQFVFLVKPDNTVAQQPISTGQRIGEDVVVEKGLQAGQTVVTEGQLRLEAGTKIATGDGRQGGGGGRRGGRGQGQGQDRLTLRTDPRGLFAYLSEGEVVLAAVEGVQQAQALEEVGRLDPPQESLLREALGGAR